MNNTRWAKKRRHFIFYSNELLFNKLEVKFSRFCWNCVVYAWSELKPRKLIRIDRLHSGTCFVLFFFSHLRWKLGWIRCPLSAELIKEKYKLKSINIQAEASRGANTFSSPRERVKTRAKRSEVVARWIFKTSHYF